MGLVPLLTCHSGLVPPVVCIRTRVSPNMFSLALLYLCTGLALTCLFAASLAEHGCGVHLRCGCQLRRLSDLATSFEIWTDRLRPVETVAVV